MLSSKGTGTSTTWKFDQVDVSFDPSGADGPLDILDTSMCTERGHMIEARNGAIQ